MGANQSTEVKCKCTSAAAVPAEVSTAVENGHFYLIEEFIKSGHINGTHREWTMLHKACYNGRDKIVAKLLTRKDLCPNLRADGGKTALMMAAENGHMDCVTLITSANLKCELDLHAKDKYGRTALDIACESKRPQIVCHLMEYTKEMAGFKDKRQTSNQRIQPSPVAGLPMEPLSIREETDCYNTLLQPHSDGASVVIRCDKEADNTTTQHRSGGHRSAFCCGLPTFFL